MTIHQQADMHRALSNPDRIAIMDYLAAIPAQATVSDIAVAIHNSPTNTVKHLSKLEDAGLIVRKRDKHNVWNGIAPGIVWPIVWRR